MAATINGDAVTALTDSLIDWRYKGMPPGWSGRTAREISSQRPDLFAAGPMGPVCVLDGDALTHNLATMSRWCDEHGVQLAPHGKTHMSPQLAARQIEAGAVAITVATAAQARMYRAFGVSDLVLANELVDAAGLRWAAAELNADPHFRLVCWVDSVRGVEIMDAELGAAGVARPLDVCVEVGAPGGRTGARTDAEIDAVAGAAVAAEHLRLVGVAGYEAALGHDVSAQGQAPVRDYLLRMRAAVLRLADRVADDHIMVTAGGSTHFDLVCEYLTGDWPTDVPVRTVLRSGCYLTHDDGLYRRTSPLTRTPADTGTLRPALSVWAQVSSRPDPDLALATMGRRDVSFDQGMPEARGRTDVEVIKLNDQHAYLRLEPSSDVGVGDWMQFGISHPCTTFDKWQLIPVLDNENRVIELIRTFF